MVKVGTWASRLAFVPMSIYENLTGHPEWDGWERAQRVSVDVAYGAVLSAGVVMGGWAIGSTAAGIGGAGMGVLNDTFKEELYQGTVKAVQCDWLSDKLVRFFR